jgi:hypothetical protein
MSFTQEILGVNRKLEFEFLRVSKYFDVKSFKEHRVTACLVARVYSDDFPLLKQPVAIGYFVHLVKENVRNFFFMNVFYFSPTSTPTPSPPTSFILSLFREIYFSLIHASFSLLIILYFIIQKI